MLAPLTSRTATALLSPSARVLAASSQPDCGVAVAPALPWADVHWPTLVALTSFERAESQVFTLLRAAPVGSVPDDVQHAVQQLYRVALFRSAELADAAGAACDALTAARVPALWLKGAALAMQSSAEFASRNMGDLDVLVAPDHLVAARAALRGAGFTDGPVDGTYAQHHHEAPMHWRSGIRLELHTALFPPKHPFTDESADIWLKRGREVLWGTRAVRVLTDVWHVVHASTHWAWSHEGEVGTWQYLHDMHRLAGGWPPDSPNWGRVLGAAELIGASRPVGWATWTAERLGGLRLIDSIVDRLRDADSLRLLGLVEREWVLRAFHSPAASPSVKWSRFWWRRAMGGLGDQRRAWPWAIGRVAALGAPVADETAQSAAPEGGGTRRVGERLRGWRRHLGRVLGS